MSDEEDVSAVAESEDGRLHIGGIELDFIEVGKLEVITEKRWGLIWYKVGMFWEFLIGKEPFSIFFWSTCAHKISINCV